MSAASDAFKALQSAMDLRAPLCKDDARYIDDNTNPQHVIELCNLCPVFAACKAYAILARPKGGIWAGKRWTSNNTKEKN